MSVLRVLSDAFAVYRLLFRRSIIVAAIVYGAIAAFELAGSASQVLNILASVVRVVLEWGAPVIVQGALVYVVSAVHEARRPEGILALMKRAGRRWVSLFGASLLYGLGILFGLLAFVIPGLLAAARWSLMVPGIMLEGLGAIEARDRSRRIVRGVDPDATLGPQTKRVLAVVGASFLLTAVVPNVFWFLLFRHTSQWVTTIVFNAIAALTAPYAAHVLSVLYYRLVDPAAPTIHPTVRSWGSVWEGPV